MSDGVHVAEVIKSEVGYHQAKGQALICLGFLVDGTTHECPEGTVKVDLDIPIPPNAKFSYRNFIDTVFPGQKKCSEEALRSLVGSRFEILTRYSPEKDQFKARNWVDRIVSVKERSSSSPAKQAKEDDPFDAPTGASTQA